MVEQDIITLNIDGKEVKARRGQTILEVARSAGIYIRNLCYYPGLKPLPRQILGQACRLCVAEGDGVAQNSQEQGERAWSIH